MSELSDLLNERMAMFDVTRIASDPYMRGTVDTASAVMSKLNAHIAEIIAQAKREQMEADCKAQCFGCKDGLGIVPPKPDGVLWDTHYQHTDGHLCSASRIRVVWAKDHPEEG